MPACVTVLFPVGPECAMLRVVRNMSMCVSGLPSLLPFLQLSWHPPLPTFVLVRLPACLPCVPVRACVHFRGSNTDDINEEMALIKGMRVAAAEERYADAGTWTC